MDQGRIVLSNSARVSFCSCRKAFEFRFLRGLRSRGYAKNLAVGTMVHDGLERYYTGAPWDAHGAGERFLAAEKELCPDFTMTDEEKVQFEFDKALTDIMVKAYQQRYDRNEWSVFGVEKEGRLHLDRVHTVDYAFKLDLIIRERSSGQLMLVEHKTVGGTGIEEYISRLELDTQSTGYWACVEALYGEPLSCVTYNLLVKPSLRLKKEETQAEFIERIRAEYQANPERYFIRSNVYRSQAQLEGWLDDMISIARDLKNAGRQNRFYRCPSSCNQWGKTCSYRSICMEDTSDMETSYLKTTTPWPELREVVRKESYGNSIKAGEATSSDGEAGLDVTC